MKVEIRLRAYFTLDLEDDWQVPRWNYLGTFLDFMSYDFSASFELFCVSYPTDPDFASIVPNADSTKKIAQFQKFQPADRSFVARFLQDKENEDEGVQVFGEKVIEEEEESDEQMTVMSSHPYIHYLDVAFYAYV